MSSARIAVPAPEHACRYDGKSPPALVAPRLMPGVHAPAGARGLDNVMVYRFVSDYTLFLRVKSSQSGSPSH
jgi:hypothetical protein